MLYILILTIHSQVWGSYPFSPVGKQSCKELTSKAPSQESAGPGPSHRIIGLVGPQVSVPSFSSWKSHAHSKSLGEFFAQRERMLAPLLMQTLNEAQRGRNLLQQGQFLLLHSRSPQQSPRVQSQGSAHLSTRPRGVSTCYTECPVCVSIFSGVHLPHYQWVYHSFPLFV